MKKRILTLAGFVILTQLVLMSCGSGKQTSQQENEFLKNTPIEMRNNKFAFDIFNAINPSHDENLVISPFSISTALAMTYAGADGNTAMQMARTLYFDIDQESFHKSFSQWMNTILEKGEAKKQLQIANSLWPQEDYPFLDEFMDLMREYYGSGFYKVNYKGDREQIRQQINAWVEKHTNDLIKDLIQPGVLTDDTRLVLVNAIYFLSNWKIAFDENATHPGVFYISRERTANVPFMYMKDDLRYTKTDNFQALELEYEGGDFSMLVVLPAENGDLNGFIKDFDALSFAQTIEKLEKQEVQVYLPSFKIRSKFDLEKLLASMGMPDAFSNRADFSKMTPLNDLKIDKVIHEAFIDVNEEGTEAAASTAVVIIRKSAIVDPPANIFRADRPFFYLIRENSSNSILFMGKVVNPAVKAN
ncbi:MAG: serpin family protein [Bacteroidales bacterium]|nr:serpin family protein [Bacteroidales bacterium]